MIDRVEMFISKDKANRLKELFDKTECNFAEVYVNTVEVEGKDIPVCLKIFNKMVYASLIINYRGLHDTKEMTVTELTVCLDCILKLIEDV